VYLIEVLKFFKRKFLYFFKSSRECIDDLKEVFFYKKFPLISYTNYLKEKVFLAYGEEASAKIFVDNKEKLFDRPTLFVDYSIESSNYQKNWLVLGVDVEQIDLSRAKGLFLVIKPYGYGGELKVCLHDMNSATAVAFDTSILCKKKWTNRFFKFSEFESIDRINLSKIQKITLSFGIGDKFPPLKSEFNIAELSICVDLKEGPGVSQKKLEVENKPAKYSLKIEKIVEDIRFSPDLFEVTAGRMASLNIETEKGLVFKTAPKFELEIFKDELAEHWTHAEYVFETPYDLSSVSGLILWARSSLNSKISLILKDTKNKYLKMENIIPFTTPVWQMRYFPLKKDLNIDMSKIQSVAFSFEIDEDMSGVPFFVIISHISLVKAEHVGYEAAVKYIEDFIIGEESEEVEEDITLKDILFGDIEEEPVKEVSEERIEMFSPYFDTSDMDVFVEPTNLCNLQCKMCYHSQDTMERALGVMKFYEFEKIMNSLKELNKKFRSLYLNVLGETFIHPQLPQFFELAGKLKEEGLFKYIFIHTNGMLEQKHIELILNSPLDAIHFSVDFVDKALYESIREGGDFDNLIENIKILINSRKQKKPYIVPQMVIMDENQHLQKEFIEFFKKLGIKNVIFAGDASDNILNLKENPELYPVVKEDSILIKEFIPRGVFSERTTHTRFSKNRKKDSYCASPFKCLKIGWDGEISPCIIHDDFRHDIGNVLKAGVKNVFYGDNWMAMRAAHLQGNFKEQRICALCKYRGRFHLKKQELEKLREIFKDFDVMES